MKKVVIVAVAFLAGAAVPLMAQDPPVPPAPVVLGAARVITPAEAAAQMTGTWKLNEELSPLPRAGSSPTAGTPGRGGGASGRGGQGAFSGGSGRPVPRATLTQNQLQQLRVRALYRELTVRPYQLKITATATSATFVDEDDVERVVTINNKKDKLDLGTSVLDCKTYWKVSALTIELEAGSELKLFEIFELSPTGRQLLVTLKTDDGDNPKAGQQRSFVQRVYDRVD